MTTQPTKPDALEYSLGDAIETLGPRLAGPLALAVIDHWQHVTYLRFPMPRAERLDAIESQRELIEKRLAVSHLWRAAIRQRPNGCSAYLLNPNRPGRSAALDTLKDLQALAETPCVLLGVPQLWDTIERQLDGGWYAQLRGRLGMVQRLSCAQIQPDHVQRVVESMGATCSPAMLRALTELAHRIGGYRNVEKAVLWAKRNGNKEVTKHAMEQYLSFSGNAGIAVRTEPPHNPPSNEPEAAAVAASA